MAEPGAANGPAVAPPAANPELIGHAEAERQLAAAVDSGRMPHAWLITGARGVGKATLAYRLARYVLAQTQDSLFAGQRSAGDGSLAMAEDHPVFRRVAAGSHPDLLVLKREVDPKTGRRRAEIVVDSARRLSGFLALTPAESAWRVAIVDSADEMNRNAANAVLKAVEEPPPKALILLISHVPGWLPATVRSRCRKLPLQPLSETQIQDFLTVHAGPLDAADRAGLARLADGSPGRALTLVEAGGLDLYRDMIGLLDSLPDLDTVALHQLCDRLARKGAEGAFTLFFELLVGWLGGLIGAGARGGDLPGIADAERATAARLWAAAGLDRWLALWENIVDLSARADRINLDRKQVVLAAFTAIRGTLRA